VRSGIGEAGQSLLLLFPPLRAEVWQTAALLNFFASFLWRRGRRHWQPLRLGVAGETDALSRLGQGGAEAIEADPLHSNECRAAADLFRRVGV
jgi:hypothetical protein